MIKIVFFTGVIIGVIDLSWRLTLSEKRMEAKIEMLKRGSLAKERIKWVPVRILLAFIYVFAFFYANYAYIWLILGIITALSTVAWTVAYYRANGRNGVSESDNNSENIDVKSIVKKSRVMSSAISLMLLAIWVFSWRGIAYY